MDKVGEIIETNYKLMSYNRYHWHAPLYRRDRK